MVGPLTSKTMISFLRIVGSVCSRHDERAFGIKDMVFQGAHGALGIIEIGQEADGRDGAVQLRLSDRVRQGITPGMRLSQPGLCGSKLPVQSRKACIFILGLSIPSRHCG